MMDVNGGSMDKKLQREILALELTIAAQLHHHVQLENRYIYIFITLSCCHCVSIEINHLHKVES